MSVKIRVMVTQRPGVFEPQGHVIKGGLHRLGWTQVRHAVVGKTIDLTFDDSDKDEAVRQTEAMCKKFLVNPVMEDYEIVVVES